MKNKSKYRITEDNRIVYIIDTDVSDFTREYTVWGISENGFIHGAGSWIRRDELGVEYTIINKPTNEEFERYYKLLEEFQKKMEEDDSEDWKGLLDDDDDDFNY